MFEFKADDQNVLAGFVVSAYILGQVFGPLAMVPLSKIVGRRHVYGLSTLGLSLFSLGCAYAPSLACLISFRFFAGVFASGVPALGAGTLTDLLPTRDLQAVHSFCRMMGFALGPVIGAYLAAAVGWRWVCSLFSSAVGIVGITMGIVFRETYGPVLLQQEVNKRRRESGNRRIHSVFGSRSLAWALHWRRLAHGFDVLLHKPVFTWYTSMGAFAYGLQYVMLTTIGFLFPVDFRVPLDSLGLCYLGFAIGCMIGWVLYVATRPVGFTGVVRVWPGPVGSFLALMGYMSYGVTAANGGKILWIIVWTHVFM